MIEPRILNAEQFMIDGDDKNPGESSVTAFNFFEAASFDEALELVKTHPAPKYGVHLELRPWAYPAGFQLPAKTTASSV